MVETPTILHTRVHRESLSVTPSDEKRYQLYLHMAQRNNTGVQSNVSKLTTIMFNICSSVTIQSQTGLSNFRIILSKNR